MQAAQALGPVALATEILGRALIWVILRPRIALTEILRPLVVSRVREALAAALRTLLA
jgi:hypothetical protein